MKKWLSFLLLLAVCVLPFAVHENAPVPVYGKTQIPAYEEVQKPYVEINGNKPFFKSSEYVTKSVENYASLDKLGRCGTAYAVLGKDIMPTEERGKIGMIKPTGWNQAKYEGIVDSEPPYLYNRCHLIGFQLAGENANPKNLITGTRYMNVDGMLPFENKVADYVRYKNKHVLYRVTPIFDGDNLLANGVLMEASSVEDKGKSISFCVFCYNVQPGVKINYKDGSNSLDVSAAKTSGTKASSAKTQSTKTQKAKTVTADNKAASAQTPASAPTVDSANYIANRNTGKFHIAGCSSVNDMKESNKVPYNTRDEAIGAGYVPCKRCNP
ncbi:DNA-entry nuclease [Lachnospiraceae bacterium]|nr:DNA-entry nuclease [Lachnospiraceae bacterium]